MDPTRDSPRDLLFAFPDGVLHYDCHSCEGFCCQDHGLSHSIGKGMPRLLQLYPEFESTAIGIDGTVLSFVTPERCVFLDEDGLCRIEKEHGKELKLDLCRIFPFNVLVQVGSVLVVAPNFLCPIELILPAQPGRVAGSHEVLEPEIRLSGLVGQRRSLAAFHASENADEFLVHERLFGEACTKGLGRHRFTDTVLSLSRDRAALGTFLARGSSILGIPQNRRTDPGPDHVDNLLHALAPSLRLSMNRLPPEGRLRALLLFEAVLRRVSALRRKPESLRGAESIYAGVGPALRLVARNTESITLPPPTDKTVTMVTNLRYGPLVLAAYAILKHAERVSTVECLELAFEETLSSALRSALLCELGRWVEARQDSHGKTAQPGPRP